MIGTIRKHSKVLWWLVAGLTIVSFTIFMANPGHNRGGGGGNGNLGTLYGQPISPDEYKTYAREFDLSYWFRNQQWPDQAHGVTQAQIDEHIYEQLIVARKAAALGIRASDDAISSEAAQLLRMAGRGQPVPPEEFDQRVLEPAGLTLADFQNFIRADIAGQQLMQALGLPGTFITPQEAKARYEQEVREVTAQAVFFSSSNYLSQVTASPAAVAQFYTNNMASYRLPDRVQINYVFFNVTNYLAQSKAEWAKTNLNDIVDGYYRQNAAQFADEKTPDAAKAKIRDELIRQRALGDAKEQANNFTTNVYAMDPVSPQNLTVAAKQDGLTVHTTAPFSADYGPQDFNAPDALLKAAFQLSADSPLAGPFVGEDGIYIIALANQLPSTIPSFTTIQTQVTEDFERMQAMALAQRVGTNFYYSLAAKLATGKTFAQAVIAGGQTPEVLPPFSLSSQEIPGFDTRAEIGQLKRAAFTTPAGKISPFVPTEDGGFILYVQSLLPVDQTKEAADLPRYISQLRQGRVNESFNLWMYAELNRELPFSPYFRDQFKELMAGK